MENVNFPIDKLDQYESRVDQAKQSTDVQRGAELVKKRALYGTKMQNVLVTNDGTNEASIPGFPYRFKAQGDKILVSVDIFKSGYECKDCKGEGRIKTHCECEDKESRPGFKYSQAQIDEFDRTISNSIAIARADMVCAHCGGDYLGKRVDTPCTLCNGTGASLFIPDDSKTLPTTGVIVSVGEGVTNPELENGVRVLFGCYTGVMIPTKVPGVAFKVLRDIEVLCIIKGGEEMAAFDFLVVDKELEGGMR